MKALLTKDYYMMMKYCRSYLIIVVIFLAVSVVSEDNAFFRYYPAILIGMLPTSLLAYDERCKWDRYSTFLPISKKQLVSSRYVLVLILALLVALLAAAAGAVAQTRSGMFSLPDALMEAGVIFSIAILSPSFILPFFYKFGTERGRIFYYIVFGAAAGIIVLVVKVLNVVPGEELSGSVEAPSFLPIVGLSLVVFALSWLISIAIYNKREI